MKRLSFFAIFFVFLFCACSSIPNEQTVLNDNAAIEYIEIGDGFYEQKNFDKAAEFYQKALISKKCYNSALYKTACSYVLGKKYDKALPLFQELLNQDPNNRVLKESIAYTNVMCGFFTQGQNQYLELFIEYPEDATLLKNYILTLVASKNKDLAIEKLGFYKQKFGIDANYELLESKLVEKTNESEQINVSSDSKKDEPKIEEPKKNEEKVELPKVEERKPKEELKKGEIDDEFSIPDWTMM